MSNSVTGYRGPSDWFYQSGLSPAEFTSRLRSHVVVPEDDKGVNKASDEVLNKNKHELQDDPFAVKVSALIKASFGAGSSKHLLTEMQQGGNDHWSSPMSELMPKDMPQTGRLEHPEFFLHGGFNEVSGTAAGSMKNIAGMHDQGPDAGTDSYENYVQEKDMKNALRQLSIKQKTAALLRKLGLAAPPAIAGEDMSLPNDAMDINTEPDLKRMTEGASQSTSSFYPRRRRAHNLARMSAVKQAIAFSFGPGMGGYGGPSNEGTSSFQKQPVQKPPQTADTKGKKPRRAGLNAEFARTQTDPFQEPKIPQGFSADDAKGVDTKTAALIKRVFR